MFGAFLTPQIGQVQLVSGRGGGVNSFSRKDKGTVESGEVSNERGKESDSEDYIFFDSASHLLDVHTLHN